jgi:hypothetical protein
MYGPTKSCDWSVLELAAMAQKANEVRGTFTYVCQRKEDAGVVIEYTSQTEMVLVYEWFNADTRFRPYRKEERVKPLDPTAIREWICGQAELARKDHQERASLYRRLWPSMLV